jgi:hypothetical protein
LECFSEAPAKAFGTMKGEEDIAAAVKIKQLITLEAGHDQMDPGIFSGTELEPVPFRAGALGRESFNHQGHLIGQRVAVDLSAK